MNITKTIFGKIGDQPVQSFQLDNGVGMKVEILEFGAIVKSIITPDKDGNIDDITLGWDSLADYINDKTYFGATVGRVANRIGGDKIVLNNTSYKIAANALPDFGKNHLHGGLKGFNKALWEGEEFQNDNEVGVRLSYLSKDGEEGYPGNLQCEVEYTLNKDNTLGISFRATTDKTTLVNITHHSYFNLAGAGSGNILNHLVQINANKYTPADEDLIPTGEIANVKGLPVDFTEYRSIGSRFDEMQFDKFKGYDLNYVLNHKNNGSLDLAAKVHDSGSGRVMEVFTTQPGMHFYTGNFLNGELGKAGAAYEQFGAVCFEPQGYPDAPIHENFKQIILQPGEIYSQKIDYQFSIDK